MILTAEQKCLLWLSNAEVTPGHLQKLLEKFHSVEEIWNEFGKDKTLLFPRAAHTILSATHSPAAVDALAEKLDRKNVNLLFRGDPDYPYLLENIQDPPYLLYYAGRLSCLQMPSIALVGTRTPSQYSLEVAEKLAFDLAQAGICVVSGLARGIDTAVHKAVLEAEGRTVGVLGSGINVPYPSENRSMLRKIAGGIGLIISEYPLDAPPVAYHFPHRNRIISGLCMGTVLIEGKIQSGGMHTVHSALNQGREVFAVPGRIGNIGSEGPHAILREGARLITCADDLLEDLGISVPDKNEETPSDELQSFTPLQQQIINQLQIEEMTLQELSEQTGISFEHLMTEVSTLEILGVVARGAGNRFHLPLKAKK